MDKDNYRKLFLIKRFSLNISEISQMSYLIANRVLRLEEIKDKIKLAIYLAINNEVDTRLIIDKLSSLGNEIILPSFSKQKRAYVFCRFLGWNNLIEGPYKIRQPSNLMIVDSQSVEVVFIPGIAFDRYGIRLGYGKGVYDKLLAESTAVKIGLAYDFQIVDKLPRSSNDSKMDLIVTDKRVIFHQN